ncbi:uncharacterized protein LOC111781791 [Cucurbita pepo subsp. pepo]|uniref:uncharacterized protein LOC111781791 n=1 Tax=Cucurbita pepo subsp. pepo TaxID=3664 RepID=UPI000C9DA412|nr:uncharacterized protein LOC111781791 [Cucurbita pepo subsp. pepo]
MKLIHHNFIPSSIFSSSLSNRNSNRLRQFEAENVRPHVPLAMRRVPAKIIPNFQSSSVYPKSIMASDGAREIQSVDLQRTGVEEKEKKATEKKAVKLPPPPEKPLPGDCCGSGCVRCVWDVYYEELEDYNKLCEKGSASNS